MTDVPRASTRTTTPALVPASNRSVALRRAVTAPIAYRDREMEGTQARAARLLHGMRIKDCWPEGARPIWAEPSATPQPNGAQDGVGSPATVRPGQDGLPAAVALQPPAIPPTLTDNLPPVGRGAAWAAGVGTWAPLMQTNPRRWVRHFAEALVNVDYFAALSVRFNAAFSKAGGDVEASQEMLKFPSSLGLRAVAQLGQVPAADGDVAAVDKLSPEDLMLVWPVAVMAPSRCTMAMLQSLRKRTDSQERTAVVSFLQAPLGQAFTATVGLLADQNDTLAADAAVETSLLHGLMEELSDIRHQRNAVHVEKQAQDLEADVGTIKDMLTSHADVLLQKREALDSVLVALHDVEVFIADLRKAAVTQPFEDAMRDLDAQAQKVKVLQEYVADILENTGMQAVARKMFALLRLPQW